MPEVIGTSKSIYDFEPRSITGCCLWLDGADSNATTSIGTGTWKDKSTFGSNATFTGSRPVTVGSLNGIPAIQFPSVASTTVGTVTISLASATGFSVFFVANMTSAGASDTRFISTTTDSFRAFANTGSPITLGTYVGANLSTISLNITANTPFLYSGVVNSTSFYEWENGIPNSVAGTTSSMTAANLYIGNAATPATGNMLIGQIGEVIVYNQTLLVTDRQTIEGYLAWKWGVQSYLPTTHPFPLMKPFFRLFNPTDVLVPLLWFDAADTSTITGTTAVTAWANKGSWVGSALSSSGAGTLVSGSTTQNGLNVVVFPGSARLGFTVSIPYQPRAWFAVFKQTSQVTQTGTGGLLQYFAIVNQTAGNGQDSIFGPAIPTNTGTSSYYMSEGASGIINNIGTSVAPNGYNVMKQYVWVNSTTTASNYIGVEGVSMTLSTSVGANSYTTSSVLYALGDNGYGNSGQVAEVMLFNSEITTGQRQAIESYLALKWGLTLTSPHPYAALRPLSAIPFSPTNISSCILWLDGDDPAGTGARPASGSTVSSWKDKSGQANHFTGYNSTLWTQSLFNGCGGITMSGSSTSAAGSYFQLPAASVPLNVNTTCTLFVMCSVLATTVAAGRLFSTNYAGQTTADNADTKTFDLEWSSSTTVRVKRDTSSVLPTVAASTLIMFSIVFDGANMYLYKSGVLSGTGTPGSATGYAASTGSFGFDTIAIGRLLQGSSSGNYSFNGYALEYIMYNEALTTVPRQQVEGYLSAKWGATLSVSHPYYKYVPAQQGFDFITPSTITSVTLSSLASGGGTLSWTASTNAVEYYWYIGTASGSGTILAQGHVSSGTITTSFTAGLTSGVTYYGWVIPRSSTLTNGATTIGSGSWSSVSYATGGSITTTGGRRFHTFTTNDNFILSATFPSSVIEVMAIGGGGGGGCQSGGGGGAGNMVVATFTSTTLPVSTTYAVVIGPGGAGGVLSTSTGTTGTNTTFASTKVIAKGGGGGGTYSIGTGGLAGGCGGGGAELGQLTAGAAGTGSSTGTITSNLATAGGTGYNTGSMGGAGGGGTAAKGTDQVGPASAGTDGGAGTLYYGSYYGGGGGGTQGGTYWGAPFTGGAGGTGGGGRGSSYTTSTFRRAGTANTGGGGGGCSGATGDTVGGAGGSGICIISYVFP